MMYERLIFPWFSNIPNFGTIFRPVYCNKTVRFVHLALESIFNMICFDGFKEILQVIDYCAVISS